MGPPPFEQAQLAIGIWKLKIAIARRHNARTGGETIDMTPRDRLLTTIRGGVADRVPLVLEKFHCGSPAEFADPLRREITERVYDKMHHSIVAATGLNRYLVTDSRHITELSRERQGWLVRTGCRYIWAEPEVVAARKQLYANVDGGEERVLRKIADVMSKYYRAFGLEGVLARRGMS